MHRREAIYGADANSFRPSRWEDGKLAQEAGFGFLDFHGGPRVCLGSKSAVLLCLIETVLLTMVVFVTEDYALMESSYATIRILQRYPDIRLPPNEPNEPLGAEKQNLSIVLTNADGVKVLLA